MYYDEEFDPTARDDSYVPEKGDHVIFMAAPKTANRSRVYIINGVRYRNGISVEFYYDVKIEGSRPEQRCVFLKSLSELQDIGMRKVKY